MEWIIPKQMLINSPSRADGMKEETEKNSRAKTCWFIEMLGKELFRPEQATQSSRMNNHSRLIVSTAQVLFHRFYAYQSFLKHDRFIVATAALFLATKVEEAFYFRLQHIVKAYLTVRQIFKDSSAVRGFDSDAKEIENKVLLCERLLLHTLCFELQITHPYKFCIEKVKLLRNYISEDQRQEFYQTAVNFLNDSYRTTLCLQYPPQQIALGGLFLSALHMGISPVSASKRQTTERTWFELLQPQEGELSGPDKGIDERSLLDLCTQLLNFYSSEYVWSDIDSGMANTLKGKLPRVLADSSQVSPDCVTSNLSGQHTHSFNEMQWRDDGFDEVDINDPYPYDDDERTAPSAPGQSAASSSSSSHPTPKKRSVRVTIVSRQHSPLASSSSFDPHPPSDYMSTPSNTHSSLLDSSTLSATEPSPMARTEDNVGSTSSSSSNYPLLPISGLTPSLSEGTPSGSSHPFLRARSLSEDSSQPVSQYSAASPPPPPPDTPASSISVSEHRHPSYSFDGDTSPPPPPPDTPDMYHCDAAGTYDVDDSDFGGKTSPKRQRIV